MLQRGVTAPECHNSVLKLSLAGQLHRRLGFLRQCSLSKVFWGIWMRLMRNLLVSGSAAVMAGALTFSAGPMVTTAAAHHAGHASAPSAKFIKEARTALVSYLRHNHPTVMLAHHGRTAGGIGGTTKAASFNWSGYANTSTKHGAF